MLITYHHLPIKFNEQTMTYTADQLGNHQAIVIGHGQDWNNYKLVWDTNHEIDFEHPDHVELQDYDHYHRAWQKPPVDCYLCHDTINKIDNWLIKTPINTLHPVCTNCGDHLIDTRMLKLAKGYTLKDFGFPFINEPDEKRYLIDQHMLAKCQQCGLIFPSQEGEHLCKNCR